MTIGERIKYVRENNGISQTDLANAIRTQLFFRLNGKNKAITSFLLHI